MDIRFESWLVDKFNSLPDWEARRLGGASTGLPDLIAVNNKLSILYAIEAKSLRGNSVDIPPDEIKRCQDIVNMFSIYSGYTIVATRLGENKHPFYSYWDIQEDHVTKCRAYIKNISIHYTSGDIDGEKINGQLLEDNQWPMPWQRSFISFT